MEDGQPMRSTLSGMPMTVESDGTVWVLTNRPCPVCGWDLQVEVQWTPEGPQATAVCVWDDREDHAQMGGAA